MVTFLEYIKTINTDKNIFSENYISNALSLYLVSFLKFQDRKFKITESFLKPCLINQRNKVKEYKLGNIFYKTNKTWHDFYFKNSKTNTRETIGQIYHYGSLTIETCILLKSLNLLKEVRDVERIFSNYKKQVNHKIYKVESIFAKNNFLITKKSIDSLGWVQFDLSYDSKTIFFEIFWENLLHMPIKILIKFLKKFPIILDCFSSHDSYIFYDTESNKIFFR